MKDANKEPQIDEKILDRVCEVFEEIELGCCSNDQKEQLIKNAGHLMKSLCFIRKYWRVLLPEGFVPSSCASIAISVVAFIVRRMKSLLQLM